MHIGIKLVQIEPFIHFRMHGRLLYTVMYNCPKDGRLLLNSSNVKLVVYYRAFVTVISLSILVMEVSIGRALVLGWDGGRFERSSILADLVEKLGSSRKEFNLVLHFIRGAATCTYKD